MSLFFQTLRDNLAAIRDTETLYKVIAAQFAPDNLLRDWQFDSERERPAALALAQENPEVLVFCVYGFNAHLQHIRRQPQNLARVLFEMKRAVADALATLFPAGYRPAPVSGGLRVAIPVPWLPANPNNNILRVVTGYAGGLLRHPDVEDVTLVLTNEASFAAPSALENARQDARLGRDIHQRVAKEFGVPPDKLRYAPPAFLEQGNVAWHQDFLASFQPNVIFVPNFEMSAAYTHAFGKQAATVYLQTSVRNRPPYDFTRYLYLGEKRRIDNSHIHPESWFYHAFGYENFGAQSLLTRADIGLREKDFVAVTAGNRLEREIDPEIIGVMADLMESRPHVTWMMLGVQNEAAIRANLGPRFASFGDRLVFKSYVMEIGTHLALSDIYVNPRRTGGAVSIALAIYGQTPVLSFVGNDAGNFLIDEMIHETPETYLAKLTELADDPSRLAAVEAAQGHRFEQGHTIDASVRDLVGHFHAAIATYGSP